MTALCTSINKGHPQVNHPTKHKHVQGCQRAIVHLLARGDGILPTSKAVSQAAPWSLFDSLPTGLQADLRQPPLHALLVTRSCISHTEAMVVPLQWLVAMAQVHEQWLVVWRNENYEGFRRVVPGVFAARHGCSNLGWKTVAVIGGVGSVAGASHHTGMATGGAKSIASTSL